MAGSGSAASKRKSSKKKSDKASSKRKKDKRKESKKRRYADEELLSSDSSSLSDYRRRSKKSKKLRRRDHSASSYSSISDSESLSSHDNDHKSRKRKRLEISSKSKAPKRYTSPDSDTDAHRVKKRKRSSKDHIKPKKKSLKKKPKKYSSSSSSSDDSAAEGRRRRSKMELNEEVETQIDKKSHKGRRKSKIRSPRRSSLSISDNHSVDVGYIDEAIAPVNNSRRLKSVITIVSHSLEEIDTWENDPNKEEIVYDHDDYPSPRSMDSNEGGYKIESNKHSQGASDDRMVVEHAAASEEITELGKSGTNGSNKNKEGKPQPGGAHTDNFEKGKQTEDDLELILRQKALENLRKFRVGPRNARNLNEKEAKGSSSITADSIQEKSTEHDIPTTQEVNQTSALALTSDLSRKTDVKKQTEGEPFEKKPKTAKHVATQSPDGTTLTESSKEDPTISSKAVLAEAISRSNVSLGVEDTNPGKSSITEPTPSDKLISEEHILEKPQSETNDSSEFEQKTMSVMRGGEMVQVSYKVYIPKRAPGLARRQLRR